MLPNGRNRGSTHFVMLDHYIFECEAYRTMKPGPRALLWELIRRFNGENNGHIGLGVRDAAKRLMANKDTASAYFHELIERGFIAPARPGGFNMKDPQSRRSTEWRLTWFKTDCMAATKDFMDIGNKSTVPKNQPRGPEKTDAMEISETARPKKHDQSVYKIQTIGPTEPDTYISSHRRGSIGDQTALSPCAVTRAAIRHAFQSVASS